MGRIRVFVDHGLADNRSVSPMLPDFESLGPEYGRDYRAAWDPTMARF